MQTKSKERVSKHGEVFTNFREVNAMLDMVKNETERVDSRFLEPACGNGNFLAEILTRKLRVALRESTVPNSKRVNLVEYERKAVNAICSVYGIELLADNVVSCRERLFKIWDEEYSQVMGANVKDECRNAVKFILNRNIVCGNAIGLVKVDACGRSLDEPIVFSEWTFMFGPMLQRKDYLMEELLKPSQAKPKEIIDSERPEGWLELAHQQDLFDCDDNEGYGRFLKQYVTHYYKVAEYD